MVDAHARERRKAVQSLEITASPQFDVEEMRTEVAGEPFRWDAGSATGDAHHVPVWLVEPILSGGVKIREDGHAHVVRGGEIAQTLSFLEAKVYGEHARVHIAGIRLLDTESFGDALREVPPVPPAVQGFGLVRAKDTVTVRVLAERHLDAVRHAPVERETHLDLPRVFAVNAERNVG